MVCEFHFRQSFVAFQKIGSVLFCHRADDFRSGHMVRFGIKGGNLNKPQTKISTMCLSEIHHEVTQDEYSRFHHRLHIVLLIAAGCTCSEIGRYFGENPATVRRWSQRFLEKGVAGLHDSDRSGRPKSLAPFQLRRLCSDLNKTPRYFGFKSLKWSGPAIAEHLRRHYGIDLGLRQCQRLLREMYQAK